MSIPENYEVNFFRPLSTHARVNKKLIIILASIWAVGVFGFQLLLAVLNEPTPEKSYEVFQSVYPEVIDNDVNEEMKIEFAKCLLFVYGKNVAVKDNHKAVIKKSLTWTLSGLLPDSLRWVYQNEPSPQGIELAVGSLRLQNAGFDKIMIDLLPSAIVKLEDENFPAVCKDELPGIMELYLVHNQNFLTDFSFLGFPFHYWYTAQFLLIMFVVLCVVYAVVIERANKKHNFVEET